MYHNPNRPYIPGHCHRILNIGDSGSTTKHRRLNIEKHCLYVTVPFESKYQLLINGRENVRTKQTKILKAFIDYSKTNDEFYEDLEDYDPTKKTI